MLGRAAKGTPWKERAAGGRLKIQDGRGGQEGPGGGQEEGTHVDVQAAEAEGVCISTDLLPLLLQDTNTHTHTRFSECCPQWAGLFGVFWGGLIPVLFWIMIYFMFYFGYLLCFILDSSLCFILFVFISCSILVSDLFPASFGIFLYFPFYFGL